MSGPPPADARLATLEAHRSHLTGQCRRLLRSPWDAEDAVQETMLKAWCGLDGFEGRAQLGSWLRRIALHVCFDEGAGAQRRPLPIDPLDAPPVTEAVAAPADDPVEVTLLRDELRTALVIAVDRLTAHQRSGASPMSAIWSGRSARRGR